VTERFLEKYLKKLFRNTDNWADIEDGLKRLDRLTQDEAEMAAVQVLKATHTVDDAGRVRGVSDIVLSVDRRVACVGDQVQGVSDQLKCMDDKVAVVRDGAQYTLNQSSENCLTTNVHRWNRGQGGHGTSSRWRRSDGTFVVSELHSCWTCRFNHCHREPITTESS
jgi:uncharacterized membrane protein YgcG